MFYCDCILYVGAQTIPFKLAGQMKGIGSGLLSIDLGICHLPIGSTPCNCNTEALRTFNISTLTAYYNHVQFCFTVTNPGTEPLHGIATTFDSGTTKITSDDYVPVFTTTSLAAG